ncbi:hypothetical protein ACJMK2_018917 [Sinanodonta woodiana]|uniref:Mediator complex subunit Med12 domain-containing protein n=1 Tax=Sinanodonta woodiana TaxID=1069815 RepID=A0ABD3UET9_SINWO
MAAYVSQELRPMKKQRIGPPDIYPQDAKQKEDELTSTSVKLGFSNIPHFNDEYGSAKNANISQEKYGTCYSTIISKRLEINTFQDSSKKKQQLMKDNFWPVTTQRRSQMEAWFKDLAGNKPLSVLSRRVPSFNKKEEIFTTLCEFSVPIMKAAWFIKMTAAHNTAMQENKTKKRQIVDQSVDWTNALTKFMREQLQKVQDHYHGSTSGPATSFLTATQPPSQVDLDLALKQWHYCSRLARHMYDEGLLDRHEFLSWFIETMEKMKQTDDTVLKLLLSQVLQYMDEITMTAQLSRRLGHLCGKKLSQLVNESGCSSPRTQSPMLNNTANSAINNSGNNQLLPQNPLAAVFTEYNNCPQHRGIVLSLSAILQIITLMCPSALVWNNLGEGKSSSPYCGSPLDLLPCAPSSLPMPPNPQNQQIRAQIRVLEHQIILRSRAAELRWSSDKCQQSTAGFTISKVLDVLDTLDRHNFNKVEVNNCLESLYNKIFSINQNKEGNEPLVSDDPIINLLIDWAVSTQRHGAHRSIVVAKLLEKRQHDLRQEKYMESDMMDDKESLGSDAMVPPTVPSFQNLLMHYLDTKAPVLDENSSDENRQAFANLVHLFSELICLDVFSHDAYMCTLISRGELTSSPSVATLSADSVDLSSIKSQVESIKHEHQDDIKVDMDLHTMDLQSLFGPVKDDNRFSPECPPSVKSVKSEKEQPVPSVGKSDPVPPPLPPPIHEPKGPSRHMLYATHFPIPQDENSSHECNQRMIVLFGVGKDRDTTRHVSRKVSKEILKLYSKKNCIDISSGDLGKTKKKKEKEGEIPVLALTSSNFESIFAKFQKLSYYDQHAVAYQCATSVIEQINSFTSGNSSYLPLVENIAYMFDLMEYSLNIRNLLEFSIKLLTEMQKVEASLMEMNSSLSGNYTTNLCLYIVGIFRKYHSYLIVSEDMTTQAFEGLIGVVKHVCNPADCTSAERCILAYLYDVYNPCCYLRAKFYEMFYNVTDAYSKIRLTLYAEITPAASNLLWDPHFMREVINNVKTQPDNQLIKQLNEVPASRYSFVCNAMLELCISQGVEKLNEISILCAELTARCNSLSAEWLGVLKALCCSSNHSCGFIDVLTQIDVSDLSIHDSLAVFVSILIARHCFSLQDFIQHVALPSLMAPAAFAEHGDQDAEPGARLTCHLLLCLFKIPRSVHSPHQTTGHKGVGNIRASCDRHLLAAAHDNIDTGAFLAVLKANLVLGDSCSDKAKSKGSTGKKDENRGDIISTLLNSLDDELGIDMMLGSGKGGMENAGLGEFSKHSLKEMCGQDWVREKFLQDPESLLTSEGLLDSMLTPEQAELLVEMICYPNGVPNQIDCSEPENSEIIERILGTLDQWTLRVSLLELNLMFKLAATTAETNSILDNIAEETIQLFYQQSENIKNQDSGLGEGMSTQTRNEADKDNCVWMVAPLISKLPSTVQGRVLKLAGQVLESSNNLVASKSKQDKERNQRSKSLLSHQPFLSLILTCLKGQDEQREGLLLSLLNQLEKCIANFKEMLEKYPDEGKIRSNIHETLQLRLFLVGGMFDTIQRNTSSTMEWGQLLVQLISSGVVDLQSNYELFTTVLDMLNALLLGTLVPDLSEKGDDNKKTHSNLVKKLRKELGDKYFEATDKIRQLFPLPKKFFEIVTVEPHGSLVDTKGNKIAGFDSIGRKQVPCHYNVYSLPQVQMYYIMIVFVLNFISAQ